MKRLFFDYFVYNIKVQNLINLFTDCANKKAEIHLEVLYDDILEEIREGEYQNRRFI